MKNEFTRLQSIQGEKQYIIEQDLPEIGWYLKVFEKGSCVADHLQNDLETVISLADEQYSVPPNSWEKIK